MIDDAVLTLTLLAGYGLGGLAAMILPTWAYFIWKQRRG